MMTHGEIEAAIERLRKISHGTRTYNALEAVEAVIPDGSWADGLIDLLEQADPDTHMERPMDADGVPLHIGDEVYARCKNATYCHYYYYNGIVKSIEFEDDKTYSYVMTTDDEDGDQFETRELHHGRHIPTSAQILEDLVDNAFVLGVDSERSKETYSNATWEARRELVKQYTEQLRPLLSDDAE